MHLRRHGDSFRSGLAEATGENLPAGGAGLDSGLGVTGAHIALLEGGVGLLLLQRYIWLLGLEAREFGPYQTASYLLCCPERRFSSTWSCSAGP